MKSVMRIPILLSVALAGFSIVAFGQEPTASNQSNTLLPGGGAQADLGQARSSAAIAVNMSEVPAGTPRNVLPPPAPRGGISAEEYKARKAEAAKGLSFAPGGQTGAAPASENGRETPGASRAFRGQSQQGTIAPADMAVAVSANYVVQLVNSSIAVYNKSGVIQPGFPKPLSTFFSNNTGDIGDVRAFYDWSYQRFVVLADDFTAGVIHVAASATSNPLGAWYQYTFAPWGAADCRTNTPCPDFPQLGYDTSTIYIGVNFFANATTFSSDWMLLLPKAKIYAGAPFGYNFWFNLSWNGVRVDTVHPSVPVAVADDPRAGLAVSSFNINSGGGQCLHGCNGLVFWAFSNNLPATGSPGPELSAVGVATAHNYSLPASANEPGCAGCIDTGDVRISGTPTYHSGVITASLNTNGSDAHSHALWFQARVFLNDNDARCTGAFLNDCPRITRAQLLNEDCFFCGGQGAAGSSFYGALAPTVGGDVTMVYNYSDNNTNVESAYTARRATQAQNTMHDPGFILCGGSSTAVGRWGDYEANVIDLSSTPQSTWFSGMNALGGGTWGTCIGNDGYGAINQP